MLLWHAEVLDFIQCALEEQVTFVLEGDQSCGCMEGRLDIRQKWRKVKRIEKYHISLNKG